MQPRKLLSCLLIGVVLVLVTFVPSVHAQTTSIKVLSSPPSVVLSSDGSARFDAAVQVSYAGLPLQTVTSNQYELLLVGLTYYGTATAPNGTAASNPDPCQLSSLAGAKLLTTCLILPYSSSGTDTVLFHAIIYNATPQRYHFQALAAFVALIPQTNTVMHGSDSYADFYVSVVNGATATATNNQTYASTSAVTSTPSLQMPQPPQPYSQQPTAVQSTDDTPQLILALAITAAVVLAAVFLYSRRKGQTAVTKAEKVDIDAARLSTKTAEGKRFCIECGNELPPNLKFCDSCGTKQP